MNDKKQVVVIHGGEAWDTYEEYIKYLKDYEFTEDKFNKVISKRWKDNLQNDLGVNFQVVKLEMPSSRNAKYNEWSIWFEKVIPYLTNDVILLGHSLGAIFLAKYLAENKLPVSVSQLYLVAGVFGYSGGFNLSESFELIEKQCRNIYIYHSVDDEIVDFDDALKFQEVLPSAKLVKFNNRNHFLQERFPEIVENIKSSML